MQERISPEEIQALRKQAEKEHETHARVMTDIKFVSEYQSTMLYERQLEIVTSAYARQREDEVIALLKAYVNNPQEDSLSPAVKLFIYDKADELPLPKQFMLKHKLLCFEVEKRIFDDKVMPFYQCGIYPPFSSAGEKYMVEQTLQTCQRADKITNELDFLARYTETYQLRMSAETALMDFLFISTGRDSKLDALEQFVYNYAVRYQMVATAQLRMLGSGNHKVIMAQIDKSPTGIHDEKVIDTLLQRGNPEEVRTYFARYAQE